MALDREQHVGEAAQQMRANRLALIGAAQRAHAALVGGDAEMVRPEPHQPLDQTELGAERGVDEGFRLLVLELLRTARPRIALWLWRGLFRYAGQLFIHAGYDNTG